MSLQTYLKETQGELKQINWPKRQQVIVVTIAVLIITGFVGYFLGLFDFLFSTGLSKLIGR